MEIAAEDYRSNIAGQKEEPENLLPVAVYSFRSKDRVFLTLDDFCKEANSDPWIGYIGIGFGSLILFGLIYDLRQKQKASRTVNRYDRNT